MAQIQKNVQNYFFGEWLKIDWLIDFLQVESELHELTASLFQEAHKMVQEANVRAAASEKSLIEADMKIDGLETEVAALKTLVLTSTPARPNRHLLHAKNDPRCNGSRPSSASR